MRDSRITWKLSCSHVCKMLGKQWTKKAKIVIFNDHTLILRPSQRTPANICINLILPETTSMGYDFVESGRPMVTPHLPWKFHANRSSRFYRAMHFSAERIHIACRPSVRPSVTLVDCDHTGWKSWKLIARAISPTPSLFAANTGQST